MHVLCVFTSFFHGVTIKLKPLRTQLIASCRFFRLFCWEKFKIFIERFTHG